MECTATPARDGSQAVNAAEYFREGTGTAVITASNAIQYALEAGSDSIDQIAEPSLFSRHIINGLRSGQADIDDDGQVSLDDLFQYVSGQVRGETTSQQPQRWYFGLDGQLVIATNPLPRAGKLPQDVIGLIENPSYRARLRKHSRCRGRVPCLQGGSCATCAANWSLRSCSSASPGPVSARARRALGVARGEAPRRAARPPGRTLP